MLFHVAGKFLKVFSRHVRVNHEDIRHFRQQRHRHEVFVDVVGLVFQHVRIDRQRADMTEDDGVAIGHGSGDFLHGGDASATGFVFNVDRLAELLAQFCGHGAGDDFRGATRRKGHHKTDGFGRPSRLRQHAGQGQRSRAEAGGLKHATA
jgi:hypothetical protein